MLGTLDLDSEKEKEVEKEVEDPLALQAQAPFTEALLDAESSDHAEESGGQLVIT